MTESRKRKLRRDRITNLAMLGLESGKLYTFKGRFRYLYKEQKPEWERIHTKIRKGDHVMFFKADLWVSSAVKKRVVSTSKVPAVMKELTKQKHEVVGKRRHSWKRNKTQIEYKPKNPIYSGMMYVGYGDKFGWINIVQMTKESILSQFEKVNMGN